jgi:hypothetical protein
MSAALPKAACAQVSRIFYKPANVGLPTDNNNTQDNLQNENNSNNNNNDNDDDTQDNDDNNEEDDARLMSQTTDTFILSPNSFPLIRRPTVIGFGS